MSFQDFQPIIAAVADRLGWDPALLAAQAWAESGFNPTAKSGAGALGLMQFMPDTWREWGRGLSIFDPEASLVAAVAYQKWIRGYLGGGLASPTELMLAAYNAGPGYVRNMIQKHGRTDWSYLKPYLWDETQKYVDKIMAKASSYQAAFSTAETPEDAPSAMEGQDFGDFPAAGESGWTSYAFAGAVVVAALLGVWLIRRIL